MSDSSVIFSKIAATPTDSSWSQAYSAGKLFTVLSLKKEGSEETEEDQSLKAVGKSILDNLETEFFTLETKTLESVNGAIEQALKDIPDEAGFSFVTAVISENILYSYIVGKGKIFIKRADQFGYVLESDQQSKEISSASGFLQNNDLIILATDGFCQAVSKDQLIESLEAKVPSEIAENIAPTIHETDEAGAAAIILSYKQDVQTTETISAPIEEEEKPTAQHETPEHEPSQTDIASSDAAIEMAIERNERGGNPLSLLAFPLKLFPKKLTHSKKIYLTIVLLVIIALGASIFLGIKKQNDAKIQAQFDSFYPTAQKKYDDGISLKDLNANLALDDFKASKQILDENKSKLPADSTQAKQVNDLLSKVESELSANPTPTAIDKSKLTIQAENGSGVEGAAGKLSDTLKELGYTVSGTSNADNYNYEGITIKVKESAKAYLDGLKSDLSKNYTVSSATSDLSAGSPTDAVVIIGK